MQRKEKVGQLGKIRFMCIRLGRDEDMMGETEGQPTFYYNMSVEQFVPQDHPLRAIYCIK